MLGWVVLDQRLNGWQLLGAVVVLVSVVLGQQATWTASSRRAQVAARSLASPS